MFRFVVCMGARSSSIGKTRVVARQFLVGCVSCRVCVCAFVLRLHRQDPWCCNGMFSRSQFCFLFFPSIVSPGNVACCWRAFSLALRMAMMMVSYCAAQRRTFQEIKPHTKNVVVVSVRGFPWACVKFCW